VHTIFTTLARPPGRSSVLRSGAWLLTAGSPRSAHQVLVVEDEPTLADAVAARLRAEGFDVDVAGDGVSAVTRRPSGSPHSSCST
jgi:PleD family two-component response regulator